MRIPLLCFYNTLLVLGLFSCKKDKLKAQKASFLVINNVFVNTAAAQGSNSHKITDIWYYVNNQFKGIYPIGKLMPIVAEKSANIKLFAGIKNNGISDTRLPYEFYEGNEFNINIEEGETYPISADFKYSSNAIFYYSENFDSSIGGSIFSSTGDSAFSNTKDFDASKSFGGKGGSIFMSMNDNKPTAKLLQTAPYFIPSGGTTVYLELNYKSNQSFIVGVIGGGTEEREALIVNPSSEWNKIYIQLTKVISQQPTYSNYHVYIKAVKTVSVPQIYIDNIKLLSS